MNREHVGLTLVELLIVVVIAGALAVLGYTKYQTMTYHTRNATISSLAAALSAANSVNYVARKKNPASGIAVANCTDLMAALKNGLPAGYRIASLAIDVGINANCTLSDMNGTQATFVATGIH